MVSARPRQFPAVDPVKHPTLVDQLVDLQRRSPAPTRVLELHDLLSRYGWSASVPAARTPGARTTRRYLVWRRSWPNGTAVTLYQEPASLGTGNNITDDDARRWYLPYTEGDLASVERQLGVYTPAHRPR